ncbi:MAG: flagellar biosynthesis anti-sigma factor FlgM [Tissierellia bacterium]|nr:flagellar biosynthesis anti-sigma factor FlgM [Tissierellia bacterium]
MRVNNISNNMYVYQGQKEKPVHATAEVKKENYNLKISDRGAEYQFALKKVKEEDTFRTDKVNAIKEKIQNGTYDISAREIAQKMVKDIFGLR